MLKFFFSRNCFMVRLMEGLGVAGLGVILWQYFAGRLSLACSVLVLIICFIYLFTRFCTIWSWYPNLARNFGIGLQFQKAMISTSYTLAIMTWLFIFFTNIIWLLIAVFFLVLTVHVNIILLYLHFKDQDKTAPNAYSLTSSSGH